MDAPRVELNMLEPLLEIRRLSDSSTAQTQGLSDGVIERFCNLDPQLIRTIDEASISFASLVEEVGLEYLTQDETTLVSSCLLYTSPSPRDATLSRMPSSA